MNPSAEALKNHLQAELLTMGRLWEALQVEQKALLGNEIGDLELATQRKNQALLEHQERQEERLRWAATAGLGADLPLSQMVESVAADAALADLAGELANLADRCQEANRRNGGLILRLQDHTRSALLVLRGESPGTDVYSLSGAREHRVDGKSLGKA